ncbi:hypothetical protein LCGC14_2092690 [marine sediment metagenome]|uniref:Uncharacterized protein n=1 Tax=marine sediment metagenome TaxID=412755 RepID=A0A0F9GQB2_9ZZZZ
MGNRKKQRTSDILFAVMRRRIYDGTRARIVGFEYGVRAAKFDELVRKGIIKNERDERDKRDN